MSGQLRQCETCHGRWPRSADHDLRGFGWLDPLPRRIGPSNGDCILHDGAFGRNRFLFLEAKMPWEPVLQAGQNRLLAGLAKLPGSVVRLLGGTLFRMALHRVTERGVDPEGCYVAPAAFRASVVDFLNGQPWADPPRLAAIHPDADGPHIHGFHRTAEGWRCIQDYYAAGDAPETGCGLAWAPPKF